MIYFALLHVITLKGPGYSRGGKWKSLFRQSILLKLEPRDGTTRTMVPEVDDANGKVVRWTAK